jgi:hypothetical protein
MGAGVCYVANMQRHSTLQRLFTTCVAVLSILLLTGCRSTPKIDWDSRVHSYSYDQAVLELGPPNKVAKLSDGSTVAEWISERRTGSGLSIGVGSIGRHSGVSVGQSVSTGGNSSTLRLVFGKDNLLTSWSKR